MARRMTRYAILLLIFLLACHGPDRIFSEDNRSELNPSSAPLSFQEAEALLVDVLGVATFKVQEPVLVNGVISYLYQVHDPEMRWEPRLLDVRAIRSHSLRENASGMACVMDVEGGEPVEFTFENKRIALRFVLALDSLRAYYKDSKN